jgi:hypothetical protein
VTCGGVQYPGRHEPLVTIETFATVQAILQSRTQASERQRKHNHYLKGSIYCGRCGSRLSFSRSRGRSGATYDYFFCLGRHARRTECDLPALWVDAVEEAVARQYRSLELNQHTVERLRDELVAAMRLQTAGAEKLARKERADHRAGGGTPPPLQAHLAGAVPLELLKEQQDRITRQLADAGAALAATEVNWENIETNLRLALKLVATFEDAYRQAAPTTRRRINQAVFEAIALDVDGVTYTRLTDQFSLLLGEDSSLNSTPNSPTGMGRGRSAV